MQRTTWNLPLSPCWGYKARWSLIMLIPLVSLKASEMSNIKLDSLHIQTLTNTMLLFCLETLNEFEEVRRIDLDPLTCVWAAEWPYREAISCITLSLRSSVVNKSVSEFSYREEVEVNKRMGAQKGDNPSARQLMNGQSTEVELYSGILSGKKKGWLCYLVWHEQTMKDMLSEKSHSGYACESIHRNTQTRQP